MKYASHKERISTEDLALLQALFGSEIELLVNSARPALGPGQKVTKLDYLSNPGVGTIRWIYPRGLGRPLFLSTYNSPTRKAKLYAFLIRLCFSLKLSWLIRSGSIAIRHQAEAKFPGIPIQVDQASYAIFTGTVGPNRKAIAVVSEGEAAGQFIKIPLGKYAVNQLLHEAAAIKEVAQLSLTHWKVPQVYQVTHRSSIMESLATKERRSPSKLMPVHLIAVRELTEATLTVNQANKQQFLDQIDQRLKRLEKGATLPGLDWLRQSVASLKEELNKVDIPFAYAHGDFTPWNMYTHYSGINVYDWEMAGMRPVGYDVFHFVFQSEVLVEKHGFAEIQQVLDDLSKQPEIQKWCADHNFDFALALKCYLMEAVTTYLLQFQEQGVMHIQATWLMQTWAAALQAICSHSTSCRREFLTSLSQPLNELNYALMRGQKAPLKYLPLGSDLDLLVTEHGIKQIQKWVEEYPTIYKVRVFPQSFMDRLEIHFVDGGFLSLDLIHDIRRKGLRILSASELLHRARPDEWGIWRLGEQDQLAYGILFYGLNHHLLPEKLVRQHQVLSLEERVDFSKRMKAELGLDVSTLHLQRYSDNRDRIMRRKLRKSALNRYWKRPFLSGQYVLDVLKRWATNKGMVITFSGVDGAGKSTVLEEAAAAIGQQYRRKTKILRHRPSMLPILSALRYGRKGAEKRSVARLPRQGKNGNLFSSALRFAWYYLDYFLGQWVIWLRYERRGYVVLYDRYYFDMIADPERTNFRLPVSFVRWMGKWIRKPQLNILLTAEPDVIRKRKQELSKEAIKELTQRYRRLFHSMSKTAPHATFLTLHNKSISNSVARVLSAYRQAL